MSPAVPGGRGPLIPVGIATGAIRFIHLKLLGLRGATQHFRWQWLRGWRRAEGCAGGPHRVLGWPGWPVPAVKGNRFYGILISIDWPNDCLLAPRTQSWGSIVTGRRRYCNTCLGPGTAIVFHMSGLPTLKAFGRGRAKIIFKGSTDCVS